MPDNQYHKPVKKAFLHDVGDVEVRCTLCNMLLYDSFGGGSRSTHQGVYDLGVARFCPNYGVKFE